MARSRLGVAGPSAVQVQSVTEYPTSAPSAPKGREPMGFLKRLWGYIATLFRRTAEGAMNPEIEVEQAINEARKRDQELRNQAAKVVAHRTQIESKMENAADDVGEAREMAKQALLRAEKAKSAGDAEGVAKWTRTAQSLAMKLQAAENNLSTLRTQYDTAASQADKAKDAVQQNATRVSELAAKRMELLGSLEAAKMQESVNKAVDALSNTMDYDMPSLEKVEEKIEARKAQAMAKAELHEATPAGAEAELKEAINMVQADAKLEELKAELGLTS
jgi:phage shock protein A